MLFATLALSAVLAPQEPALGGLASAPRSGNLTVVVADPQWALIEAIAGFEDIDRGSEISFEGDAGMEEACRKFGVLLDDPSTWANSGFDLRRPARFGLADPGGFLGLPQTSWFVFAAKDPERVHEFLRTAQPDAELDAGEPNIYTTDRDREAWCVRGRDVYVLSTGLTNHTAADRLREQLAAEAKLAKIGADPVCRMMERHADATVRGGMFLDVQLFRPEAPIRAILATLSDVGLEVGLACDDLDWIDATRPGRTARDMLARFEKPAIAMSTSLADPFAVVEAIGDAEPAQMAAVVRQLVGDDVRKWLRNSAGAIALYPRSGSLDEPRVAGCLRTQFAVQIFGELVEAAENDSLDLELEVDGDWVRGEWKGESFVVGRVDDYLLFGDAVQELRAAARSQQAAWVPQVGGRELFALEVDTLAVGMTTKAGDDPERVAALERTGTMVARVASDSAGFMVGVEFVGSKGEESFLRRLIRALGAFDS